MIYKKDNQYNVGNFAENKFATQAFGRGVSPLIGNAFSTASGEATEYAVDGIKNQYHNYNEFLMKNIYIFAI